MPRCGAPIRGIKSLLQPSRTISEWLATRSRIQSLPLIGRIDADKSGIIRDHSRDPRGEINDRILIFVRYFTNSGSAVSAPSGKVYGNRQTRSPVELVKYKCDLLSLSGLPSAQNAKNGSRALRGRRA